MLSRETNLDIFTRALGRRRRCHRRRDGPVRWKDAASLAGTTAEMAIWLDAATVLVLDASAMAGSAAAVVHGFDTLLPELRYRP